MSDLHIGKSVNAFPMIEEQKHAFKQMIGYIKTERPAAVIIAGDVYDRAVPSVEAVNVFDDFLTELASFSIAIMLIPGNHDSPERISYASRLLLDKNLYLCGPFDERVDKVTLTDEFGEVNFWLLPFIRPYENAVAAALETADIDYAARNVLVSHQFYTKADFKPIRSDSELNYIGGLDAVDAGLVKLFDYTALGHLHGRQSLAANIHYSGSPVKYSFSEWQQEKSVTVVELKEKGELTVKQLAITPIHDMREIKGELETLISREVTSLADTDDYIRAVLTDDEEIIDPLGKLRSVYPNIMSLDFDNSRTSIDISAIAADIAEIEKISPFRLFNDFFLETNGSIMSLEQAAIVRRLLETEGEE